MRPYPNRTHRLFDLLVIGPPENKACMARCACGWRSDVFEDAGTASVAHEAHAEVGRRVDAERRRAEQIAAARS